MLQFLEATDREPLSSGNEGQMIDNTTENIATLLATAQRRLAEVSDTPRLDAEVLFAHVLGKSRSHLRAWPERVAAPVQAERFMELLARRLDGEPVAYITGRREFWSLDLVVTPATLIPRPETELLVELALDRLPPNHPWRVADLGTGSGAIALAIAHERPDISVFATDASAAALVVAEANARRLEIGNVTFHRGDWCAVLGQKRFDLIVANPPYLAAGDPHLAQGDLRFEPRPALAAAPDGLGALRAIIAQAMDHLQAGGWLVLEHGYDQGDSVPALLRAQGFTDVADHPDAASIPRAACGRRPD